MVESITVSIPLAMAVHAQRIFAQAARLYGEGTERDLALSLREQAAIAEVEAVQANMLEKEKAELDRVMASNPAGAVHIGRGGLMAYKVGGLAPGLTEKTVSEATHFTTSEAAAIVGCNPRTIAKWADRGVIPCVKTPGGNRRMICKKGLVEYLRDAGYPVPDILVGGMLVLGIGTEVSARGFRCESVHDLFEAGLAVARRVPRIAVVDFGIGRINAVRLAYSLRRVGVAKLVGVINEDEGEREAMGKLFDIIVPKPCPSSAVTDAVATAEGREQ